MPVRDETRWTQNADGTWSRTVDGVLEHSDTDPDATSGAKQAADEMGVDLNEIEGSGKEGRITKADVEKAKTQ